MTIDDDDLKRLSRCIALAREALDDGDEPLGSILVDDAGLVLFEDRNRVKSGDHTRHPEFAIAQWAAANLTQDERARATVYTSGEHGRIVYATSSEQLTQWLSEWGSATSPVAPLTITTVAPRLEVDGPAPKYAETMRSMYEAKFRA